ncbi:MAG: hypothetical protein IJX14_06445 [Clostridia bacterium]|nr:hypothetical protein [Clostridia bacterium]
MKRKQTGRGLYAAVLAAVLIWPAGAAGTDPYTDTDTQWDTVPAGWIGVYTAEDLDAIRRNPDGQYILMNDIVIPEEMYGDGGLFEGGFEPIGKKGYAETGTALGSDISRKTSSGAFTGIFDGNGYEISGLHITAPNGNSAGLFGACETEYVLQDHSVWENTFLENGSYIREDKSGLEYRYTVTATGGVIRNLGIADSSVKITVDHTSYLMAEGNKINVKGIYDSLYVGMIAGYADAVEDCYVRNAEIRVEMTGEYDAPHTGNVIAVGGLVGKAGVIRNCLSDSDVVVVNNSVYTDMRLYKGDVCGITTVGEEMSYTGTGSAGTVRGLPMALNQSAMEELCRRVLRAEYNMSFDHTKVAGMTPTEMKNHAIAVTGISVSGGIGYLTKYYGAYRTSDLQAHPCYGTAEERLYMLDPNTPENVRYAMERMIDRLFTAKEWEKLCGEKPAGGLGTPAVSDRNVLAMVRRG